MQRSYFETCSAFVNVTCEFFRKVTGRPNNPYHRQRFPTPRIFSLTLKKASPHREKINENHTFRRNSRNCREAPIDYPTPKNVSSVEMTEPSSTPRSEEHTSELQSPMYLA